MRPISPYGNACNACFVAVAYCCRNILTTKKLVQRSFTVVRGYPTCDSSRSDRGKSNRFGSASCQFDYAPNGALTVDRAVSVGAMKRWDLLGRDLNATAVRDCL